MILSDQTILDERHWGRIVIDPFIPEHLGPNSIDFTLAPEYKVYKAKLTFWQRFCYAFFGIVPTKNVLDCKADNPTTEGIIPPEGMVLMPDKVYLYRCNERLGCKESVRAKVEGKSSLGRLGLFIHVTAGFIDTGFEGSLVLELVATEPIRIYPNQKICQIEFARVEGNIAEDYSQKTGSKYMNQDGVVASKMHKNF